jgi:hypothetical protein
MIPIPVPITRPVYPTAFYFILFTFPFLTLVGNNKPTTTEWIVTSTISVALIASFIFIQWRCSSWAVSYWDALGAKCVSLESGCINITLFYIFPLLLFYHVRFFVIAVRSLFRGRAHAQVATLNFIKGLLVAEYPYEEAKRLLYAGETPRMNSP